jgi:hypothetical protein
MLIEAVCRRFGVWRNIQNTHPGDGKRTVPPENLVAQLLFSFTMGGTTLKHAEDIKRDPLLLEFLCLKSAADDSTLKSWLNSQTEESVRSIRRANSEMIRQVVQEIGDDPSLSASELEVAFHEREFTGNDSGEAVSRTSWQTLSIGPFLLDGLWSRGSKNEKEGASKLPALLTEHYETWKQAKTWFGADSRSRNIIANMRSILEAGFTFWSVAPPANLVAGCDEPGKWRPLRSADVSSGSYEICNTLLPDYPGVVSAIRHQSGDSDHGARCLAVPGGEYENVREIFTRHNLMMDKTPVPECIVRDFELERVPFSNGHANAVFFAIACLAYNAIAYLNSFVVPPNYRRRTTRETISSVLTTPVVIAQRPERRRAYIYFPRDLLLPCRQFIETSISRTKAGRRPWWTTPDRLPATGTIIPLESPKIERPTPGLE